MGGGGGKGGKGGRGTNKIHGGAKNKDDILVSDCGGRSQEVVCKRKVEDGQGAEEG